MATTPHHATEEAHLAPREVRERLLPDTVRRRHDLVEPHETAAIDGRAAPHGNVLPAWPPAE
jgi:hypothetical protein